jgi:hypothetical protein
MYCYLEPAGMRTILSLLVAPAGTCQHQLQDGLIVIGQRGVLEGAQTSQIANRGMMRPHDLHLLTSTIPGSEIERKPEQLHYLEKVVRREALLICIDRVSLFNNVNFLKEREDIPIFRYVVLYMQMCCCTVIHTVLKNYFCLCFVNYSILKMFQIIVIGCNGICILYFCMTIYEKVNFCFI